MEKKEKTISIKKSDLWKYSTFILLILVIFLVVFSFSKGSDGTGKVILEEQKTMLEVLTDFSVELGVSESDFLSCIESEKYTEEVLMGTEYGRSLGITGTPGFLINDEFISGARPYSDFEKLIESKLNENNPNTSLIDKDLIEKFPSLGNKDAKVIMLEFTDLLCSFCGRHHLQTHPLIKENYIDTGKIRYVFIDFISVGHPGFHEAARCVREHKGDNGFFDYIDKVYSELL